ncbi:hypothetical protein BSU04_24685 [Caballeronia sordidicola]|uniref:Uncharacterized protein n=1 Tax=Caballeronia sordidicola TaxID=196367 RepID=A0A226WYR1_CABSO|nr:hypothetical protein BSU04_24685 [Caballeronia sordidicola]
MSFSLVIVKSRPTSTPTALPEASRVCVHVEDGKLIITPA